GPLVFVDETVRAENRIHASDQQSCSLSALAVMITGHVPAVRVPPGYATSRVAAAVPASGDVEDRRNLDPAPPAHRPAARQPRRPKLTWADRALLAALL